MNVLRLCAATLQSTAHISMQPLKTFNTNVWGFPDSWPGTHPGVQPHGQDVHWRCNRIPDQRLSHQFTLQQCQTHTRTSKYYTKPSELLFEQCPESWPEYTPDRCTPKCAAPWRGCALLTTSHPQLLENITVSFSNNAVYVPTRHSNTQTLQN